MDVFGFAAIVVILLALAGLALWVAFWMAVFLLDDFVSVLKFVRDFFFPTASGASQRQDESTPGHL